MLRTAIVLYPGFQVMSLAVTSVLEFANVTARRDLYEIVLLSEHGGLVRSSAGFAVETQPFDRRRYDTVLVVGDNRLSDASPALITFLQRAAKRSRRIGGTCTGAFNLAQAGLLDGRRATTHWLFAERLRREYPKVKVEEDRIFIIDGPVWTSAGMTAGIDLALALVEKDAGIELARELAKRLVVYHRRAGGQSQFSALLELQPRSDRIQTALAYAREHLDSELSVEQLADAAHLSPRQFSRAFRAETGQSPAKAVEHLRVEAARLMLESGRHPIETVARDTGFGDRERMRRAFLRAFGQPPQMIKRAAAG
ncbi:MAG: GlxA family transcriptional regulator [Nevskia sp.]|nr:GlxA family transcriptional regulator [Nevskia sp.]